MKIDFHYHHADRENFIEDLLAGMDRAEIDKTVLLSGSPDHRSIITLTAHRGNEDTLRVMKQYPDRIIGAIYLDPRKPDTLDTFERYAQAGLRCVKMFPPAGFYPDDERFYPLYEKIQEYRMPVLFHTGLTNTGYRGVYGKVMSSKYSHPLNMDILLRLFPDIPFVFAHMGYPHYFETWAMAKVNSNVYLDISGAGCEWMRAAPFVYNSLRMAEYCPVDFKRVVWGSDNILTQYETLEESRVLMRNMGCSREDERYVFGETAGRLLRL